MWAAHFPCVLLKQAKQNKVWLVKGITKEERSQREQGDDAFEIVVILWHLMAVSFKERGWRTEIERIAARSLFCKGHVIFFPLNMTDTCWKIPSKWSDSIHLKKESESTTGLFLTLELSVLACCNVRVVFFFFQLLPAGSLWKREVCLWCLIHTEHQAELKEYRGLTTISEQRVVRKARSALDCTNQPLFFQSETLPSVWFKCNKSKNAFAPCAITLLHLHVEFNISRLFCCIRVLYIVCAGNIFDFFVVFWTSGVFSLVPQTASQVPPPG